MQSEKEISARFVSYVHKAIVRKSLAMQRQEASRLKTVPLDEPLVGQLTESATFPKLGSLLNEAWPLDIQDVRLQKILDGLSLQRRRVLYWKVVLGLTNQQVGRLLGVSGPRVSQLYRETLQLIWASTRMAKSEEVR